MKTKIIISILLCLVVYHQGVVTSHHPIGPSFTSIVATKQRLYYNNLGTRLDCSATGTPASVLTWFRTNGTDDRPTTFVQSSELIDVYENGSLFIRPFRDYSKAIHAATFVCRAENPAGSILTTPLQLKPQIYDTYEVEVKNTFGFEQSSVILSCEISPPSAASYVQIVGWLEKVNKQLTQLDLKPRTRYNFLSNQNLIIHNISKSDENRSYACIVNNRIDNNIKQSRFKPLRVRDRSPFGPELSIPNNTEYRAQAGDSIELPCGISSVSINARLSWWKNGMELEHLAEQVFGHSLILQLSSVSSNDSGHYLCRIDDDSGGRLTSHMSLKVEVPNQCRMLISPSSVTAGSNIALTCASNAVRSRPGQWQWYHDSQLTSTNNDRFLVNNVTREQMGMYQCCYVISSSDSNDCCAQTQLRVINSPPFILTDQQTHSNVIIVPAENSSRVPIDLNCTIYADPMPKLEVWKDGQAVSKQMNIDYLPSGDLFMHYRIDLRSLNETGLYQCRASNTLGAATLSKHVNLQGQKPFIQPIANLTIFSGTPFTLACYASGQPNLRLRWIDETSKEVVNTSFTSPLIFTSINSKSNRYTCQASNPSGDVSSAVDVTIQVPAKILSVSTNRTIKINETLEMSCSAEGDHQFDLMLINPQLKKLNSHESKMADHRANISWTIDHIQMSDSGLYHCYARNNYSEDRADFQILVENVPDRIETLLLEGAHRIVWMKPFDGNAKILQYLLHIRYQEGNSWSNETIITMNDTDRTSYSFEHVYSKCTLAVAVQAVNMIGSSPLSHPLHLQTNSKQLLIAPHDLTTVNISSKSVTLLWQYPLHSFCPDASIQYVIEITDNLNNTKIQAHKHHSTARTIDHLNSFTAYTFVVYAKNELGSSPKSQPLTLRTLENVPLVSVAEIKGLLLNSSTARLTWSSEHQTSPHLNGKFRTYAVTLYRNFNMSTFITMETANPSLILDDLQSASEYFVSVAICNYFECGPSSAVINIQTPSPDTNGLITLQHPVGKPLLLDCPSLSSSWLYKGISVTRSILKNNSLYILDPKLGEHDGHYQCESKVYYVQLYDRPSAIQARIHYTTSDEIGLKFQYPFDIIESLMITYQTRSNGVIHELRVAPPLSSIRLSNLSCGNIYEIIVYAQNQAGSSAREYLIGKTDGSVPQLFEPINLLQTVSDHFIILNMMQWTVDQCSILSYEVEIFPSNNASEPHLNRYVSSPYHTNDIRIDDLQADRDYQLHLKVNSEAGEILKIISFRTHNDLDPTNGRRNNSYLMMTIVAIALLFVLLSICIGCLFVRFCRQHLKNTELFVAQTRKLKPVLCSSYPDQYRRTWLRSNNEFTIQNYSVDKLDSNNRPYSYASEDSQGNINPYAVTGCAPNCKDHLDHGTFWRENKPTHYLLDTLDPRPSTTPSERYFRPIILASSSLHHHHPECFQHNPLVQIPSTCSASNPYHHHPPPLPTASVLSTVSSSQGELFSAFTFVPQSKHTSLNTKKCSTNNHILADQSSSSADSGVHSSYTQSPITKHSFRKCQLHGFSFDRPSSVNAHDDQDKHFYATYDQQFAFLRETTSHHPTLESTTSTDHPQEQYSLV